MDMGVDLPALQGKDAYSTPKARHFGMANTVQATPQLGAVANSTVSVSAAVYTRGSKSVSPNTASRPLRGATARVHGSILMEAHGAHGRTLAETTMAMRVKNESLGDTAQMLPEPMCLKSEIQVDLMLERANGVPSNRTLQRTCPCLVL